MGETRYRTGVVVVGGGLAGIVTACELLDHGHDVLIVERDTEERLGGLARESFGGVMMVGTPHQRRLRIPDSPELALADWLRFGELGPEEIWPRRWAETYVHRSRDLVFDWLDQRKVEFLPLVNWPERGQWVPGNSVPRWHITWGTGRFLVEAVLGHLDRHPRRERLQIVYGHRMDRLETSRGTVTGCAGELEDGSGSFRVEADAVVVAAGGICGGDLSRVRRHWFAGWGEAPTGLLNGSHRFADGLVHDSVAAAGGRLTSLDRHWHYAAGIPHPRPDRPAHGLSLVPARSALWMDPEGRRIGPAPLVGYTDTRHLVEQILRLPGQYSWQVMSSKIARKELAVSGSEYMTAFSERRKLRMVLDILLGNRELISRLAAESSHVVVAESPAELAAGMNRLGLSQTVDAEVLEAEIREYDARIRRGRPYFNDDQLRRIAAFRTYRGDRIRTCKFQPILEPGTGPLIAICLQVLSRKSLGGMVTDLECRVLDVHDAPVPGLYAVGESAGFGGGGIHGLRSLEGTFLGSCVLTGRAAGAAIAGVRL